jgi:putative phosphoserine phosphatase/1-acylglycerol-3-phosphate O-acyltransferase
MTRAPVIPIGIWGTEHVWPRSARLPNITNIGNPPVVRTRVGQAVELAYDDPKADTERIIDAIVELLPPEAHQPYEPTPEEIKWATPAGKDPNNPDG